MFLSCVVIFRYLHLELYVSTGPAFLPYFHLLNGNKIEIAVIISYDTAVGF
jgi:hypothetical protein